jgi:hypothetical protein
MEKGGKADLVVAGRAEDLTAEEEPRDTSNIMIEVNDLSGLEGPDQSSIQDASKILAEGSDLQDGSVILDDVRLLGGVKDEPSMDSI